MSVKDSVLQILAYERSEGASGEEIASELGISRASVWKAIQKLQEDGFVIEGVRNRGYQLKGECDPLTERGILAALPEDLKDDVTLQVYQSVESTNAILKDLAKNEAPEFTAIIAKEQSKGRGRRGRCFCSPKDTGIYLSLLVKPAIPLDQTGMLTGAVAVAVCKTIQSLTDRQPQIKWVNDVYVEGRKVCGILTEGSADLETGCLAYAVIGVGLNVYEPESGWPEEIAERAGALFPQVSRNTKNLIAAKLIEECIKACSPNSIPNIAAEYKRYSMMTDREITVRFDNGVEAPAISIGVNDDLSLQVKYDNGEEEALNTGEVSIKL